MIKLKLNYYLSNKDPMKSLEIGTEGITPKIIFVEGFDITGKSSFINKIKDINNVDTWEPGFHEDLNNKVIPYSDRYTFGTALIDLAEKGLLKDNKTYVVNRGLVTSYVYNKLYHQDIETMNNSEFEEFFRSRFSNPVMTHTIYICHTRQSSIELLFNSFKRENRELESYDRFSDINEYINVYKQFDEEYRKTLDKFCNGNYTIISSIDYNRVLSLR